MPEAGAVILDNLPQFDIGFMRHRNYRVARGFTSGNLRRTTHTAYYRRKIIRPRKLLVFDKDASDANAGPGIFHMTGNSLGGRAGSQNDSRNTPERFAREYRPSKPSSKEYRRCANA